MAESWNEAESEVDSDVGREELLVWMDLGVSFLVVFRPYNSDFWLEMNDCCEALTATGASGPGFARVERL